MKPNLLMHVERQVFPIDNFDEIPEEWEAIRTEWFGLEPLSGKEFDQAQQMQSTTTHKARCVFFAGADSQLRLVDSNNESRIFQVESVVNWMERNRYLDWRLTETNG